MNQQRDENISLQRSARQLAGHGLQNPQRRQAWIGPAAAGLHLLQSLAYKAEVEQYDTLHATSTTGQYPGESSEHQIKKKESSHPTFLSFPNLRFSHVQSFPQPSKPLSTLGTNIPTVTGKMD
jgi:hypothetical protein